MGRNRRTQDHYGKRAKKEGYAARSVYKLAEIQERFKILRRGDRVLDLGCYPGSWSQLVLERIGHAGSLVGIDLTVPSLSAPSNVRWIEGSVLELSPRELLVEIGPRDVVLSDMAPNTTGIRLIDQTRSHELATAALEWALVFLAPRGRLVLKLFQGPDTPELIRSTRATFARVRTFKPQGSRQESFETYLIATDPRDGRALG